MIVNQNWGCVTGQLLHICITSNLLIRSGWEHPLLMYVSGEIKGIGDHQFPSMEAGRLNKGQRPDPLHHCVGLWCHLWSKAGLCGMRVGTSLNWTNVSLPVQTSRHQEWGCGPCGSACSVCSGTRWTWGLESFGSSRCFGHLFVRWSNCLTSNPETFRLSVVKHLKSFICSCWL